MNRRFALLALAGILPAYAGEHPGQFAYSMPIETGAGEALQVLEIPQAVYEGSVRPHLADLRVFNGRDEAVPHAFSPRPVPGTAERTAVPLRFFPLHGRHDKPADALRIAAERTADGTVVRVESQPARGRGRRMPIAYLVDASKLDTALRTLELDWAPIAEGFSGTLRVEGSDDLAGWSTLVAAAPLLSVRFGGERLERKSVELPGVRYRYLRLSWPAGQPALTLRALAGRPGPAVVDPERRWKPLAVRPGSSPGEYFVDLGGRLPVDRLRIDLPERNTLVSVEFLTRQRSEEPWHPVARGIVYRLTRDGAEVFSADLHVAASAQRLGLLRIDQSGGGIGAGLPQVQVGWVPERLVFVARGEPPFQLAYGSTAAAARALSIETIVPGWRPDAPLAAARARSGAQRQLAGARALREELDYKTWLLWGVLGLGVAILAAMAWQLTRQMRTGTRS